MRGEGVEKVEKTEKQAEKKTTKKQGKKQEEKIGDALMKVALGYQIAEVTEEYAEVNGELKLTKRKKTKKDVPPDLKAVQLLLSSSPSTDYTEWTDEALQAEKERLLTEIKKQAESVIEKVGEKTALEKSAEKEKGTGQVRAERSVTKKSAVKKTAVKSRAKARKRVVKKKEE